MSLMVTTGEQILDTVVGAEVPTGVNLTTSLLAGPEVQNFEGRNIGGVEGIFDQGLAMDADLLGLILGS